MDILIEHRKTRFEHSVANNPYFFFGPISGILASEAGVIFVRELFANYSSAGPVLPRSVLLSFHGVDQAPNGRLTVNVGHEKIPDNLYRRPLDSPLTTLEFISQTSEIIRKYPRAGSIGGNTGTVNSFAVLDLANFTGGVFNAGDLADPVKLSCFLYQVSQILALPVLRKIFTNTKAALGYIDNLFVGLGIGCPELNSVDQSIFAQFPGAKPGKIF